MVRRRVAAQSSERAARNERFDQLAAVAGEFKSFRPAREVLTVVRAVPTIFPQFDHSTKVGGLPIERFSLVHGPSAGGKTYWNIGLLLSFLMRDHLGVLIDAERTTPITWLQQAMGSFASHPGFFADRPTTYEETVTKVRHFVNKLRLLRKEKKVANDTSALLVVDSIRKLVPQDQFKRIMKDAKAAGDKPEKVRDRSAQIKAAMNAAWLDELIPQLEETQTCMVVVARETEDPDADPRAHPANRVKTGGGRALYYDASLDMRVSRIKSYGKKVTVGDRTRLVPFGDVHQVAITKSKVSGKGEEFFATCNFHVSNGAISPAGFDRSRDLIEFAHSIDIIEGTTSLHYKGMKNKTIKWRGQDNAVKYLNENPDVFERIAAQCREFINEKKNDSEVLHG